MLQADSEPEWLRAQDCNCNLIRRKALGLLTNESEF